MYCFRFVIETRICFACMNVEFESLQIYQGPILAHPGVLSAARRGCFCITWTSKIPNFQFFENFRKSGPPICGNEIEKSNVIFGRNVGR